MRTRRPPRLARTERRRAPGLSPGERTNYASQQFHLLISARLPGEGPKAKHHNTQADDSNRRTEGPVAAGQELLLDGVADHGSLRPTEKVGDHELSCRGQKHQETAGQ